MKYICRRLSLNENIWNVMSIYRKTVCIAFKKRGEGRGARKTGFAEKMCKSGSMIDFMQNTGFAKEGLYFSKYQHIAMP